MHYYHLMTAEIPPNQLMEHPPYTTEDDAMTAATKEAADRGEAIQVFRVTDERVESQPWKVVLPPAAWNSPVRKWHYEATIASNEATPEGAFEETVELLREGLAAYDVRANSSEDVLIVRITVEGSAEAETRDRAFRLVDQCLDAAGPVWAKRRWADTRFWSA